MQIRKKLAFILTALMICSATSVPTSAKSISSAAVDEIALFYENARRVENSVSISARTAGAIYNIAYPASGSAHTFSKALIYFNGFHEHFRFARGSNM